MKNNITEIVFILDRSGSMGGLESDTIGGFNSMLRKQKKEEGEAFVSTVLPTGITPSEAAPLCLTLSATPCTTSKISTNTQDPRTCPSTRCS